MEKRNLQISDFLVEIAKSDDDRTDVVAGTVQHVDSEGAITTSWGERYAPPWRQIGDLNRWLERGRSTSCWLNAYPGDAPSEVLKAIRSVLDGLISNRMLALMAGEKLPIGEHIGITVGGTTLKPARVNAVRLSVRPVHGERVSEAVLIIEPIMGPRRLHSSLATDLSIFPRWRLPVQGGTRSSEVATLNWLDR